MNQLDPNSPESFYLSDEENQRVFEEIIIPELKTEYDFSSKDNPTAYITVRLPGTGKTSLLPLLKKESYNKILIINSDNMRVFHPYYEQAIELFGTNAGSAIYKDASIFAQKLIQYAQKEKLNFILDTTLKTPNTTDKLLTSLKSNNYNIKINILTANKYELIQGIFNRYAEQYKNNPSTVRFTNPRFIDKGISLILESAKVIDGKNINEFKILNRNHEVLYNSNIDKDKSPIDIIKSNTNLQNWNQDRLKHLLILWEATLENLKEAKVDENIQKLAINIYKELNQTIIFNLKTKSLSSTPYNDLKPNPEFFQLSTQERLEYFQESILPALKLDNFRKKEVPTAFFTGGIPGSGKSRLVREWNKNNDKLIIDADKLRKMYPNLETIEYIYQNQWGDITHPDASAWAKSLKKYSEELKIDYILDGSLKNPKNAVTKIENALNNGNKVVVSIMTTNIYDAYIGVLNRYLKQYGINKKGARYVPLSILEKSYISLADTISELDKLNLENFTLVDRDLNIIYDSKKDVNPKKYYLNFTDSSNLQQTKLEELLSNFEEIREAILKIDNSDNIVNDIEKITTDIRDKLNSGIIKSSNIDNSLNLFDELYQEWVEKKLNNLDHDTKIENRQNIKSKSINKIDDFGEKIGGAKKDRYNNLEYQDISNLNEVEVKKYLTKNNIFPSPKYEDLKNKGYSAQSAFFIKKIYTAIPSTLHQNDYNNEKMKKKFYTFIKDFKDIIQDIPNTLKPSEISKYILDSLAKKEYFRIENNTYYSAYKITDLLNKKYIKKTLIHRLSYKLDKKLKNELELVSWDKLLNKDSSVSRHSVKTEVRQLEYLEVYQRKGIDYRKNRDITVEDFWDTFKFRAGEFGNYLSQKERQKILNATYDALLDLLKVLNIKPEAISLNGNLAIAFGSRGKGGIGAPNAHYEPSKMVINLTKFKGGGSLAHEWFHALDNYLEAKANGKNRSVSFASNLLSSRKYNNEDFKLYQELSSTIMTISSLAKYSYISSLSLTQASINNVAKEVMQNIGRLYEAENDYKFKRKNKGFYQIKFENLEKEFGKSDYYKVSLNYDSGKSKIYWSQDIEMIARAFEVYVYDKLNENGMRNDFLVNPKKSDIELFKKLSFDYPYPQGKEREQLNKSFDYTFNRISKTNALSNEITTNKANKIDKNINIKREQKQGINR